MLNLTQHSATPEQLAQGVIEPSHQDAYCIKKWLTFDTLPTTEEISERAMFLADLALDYKVSAAMIGGAPFLMAPLAAALEERGIKAAYAFSVRSSIESVIDGKTVKTSSFKHAGFVI